MEEGASYTSTFLGVLTIAERLSFLDFRSNVVWVGSDATPTTCAAVGHSNRLYTIFDYEACSVYFSSVAGLPEGDFHLIAMAEYMSLICFLIAVSARYAGRAVLYVGDNANVRTWIMNRSPKNRIARYLTRLLNRLEVERGFTIYPLYVSSLNNVWCDDLSRQQGAGAHSYAAEKGLKWVGIESTFQCYLNERLHALSLILPTDNPERVREIMQNVEKRIARAFPRDVIASVAVVFLDVGAGNWSRVWETSPLPMAQVTILP